MCIVEYYHVLPVYENFMESDLWRGLDKISRVCIMEDVSVMSNYLAKYCSS